jgi:hypothetical protein
LPLPPTCRSASLRSPPHALHRLDLAHWDQQNGAEGEWPPRADVLEWLLNNLNGPSPKEQEQILLLELGTAKNAKQAAALLSTIYSRQQADNPALQSAASDLLPMREALGSESRDTAPCIEWLGIVSAGE